MTSPYDTGPDGMAAQSIARRQARARLARAMRRGAKFADMEEAAARRAEESARQAARKKKWIGWLVDGVLGLLWAGVFVALLMLNVGCQSAPSATPWCVQVMRDTRTTCDAEYGPRRRGVAGYGYTVGWAERCMIMAHAARRRCER